MKKVFTVALALVLAVACGVGVTAAARAYLHYFRRVTVAATAPVTFPSPSPTPAPSLPPPSPPPTADRAPAHALFDDEFLGPAGQAPSSAWGYDTGFGWDDGATTQTYTASRANSALDGQGHLVLTARADPTVRGGFTSARLQTRATPFRRGTDILIRARMSPRELGAWPAAWTLGEPEQDWPGVGEVDVLENWPTGPGRADFTPKYREHTETSRAGTEYTGVDPTRWHVYEARWTGATMAFLVDGRTVDIQPYDATAASTIILNIAVGSVGGPPATPWRDFTLTLDYVRVLPA